MDVEEAAPAVLLYDGECGFCSRSVLFVFRRDPEGRIRFASLQSPIGRRMLSEYHLPFDMSTLVLIDGKGAHVRSSAVLQVARRLRPPWSWGYAGILVPRPLRDAAYRLIAKHRRRLGPAVEACANPTPELRARMLS